MRALKAGKHVLVEKPCADTAVEARTLFDYAASKGLVLLEGYHYRCYWRLVGCVLGLTSRPLGSILLFSG